ncbi:MAG: hypothetical protein HOY71_46980, partial [Nonomuraea sp.]|nr:hypothetical protein [Nonomuraea sp.]
RVMIVVLLVVSPLVVKAGGWQTWLLVGLAGQAVFRVSVVAIKGRWRTARPATLTAKG